MQVVWHQQLDLWQAWMEPLGPAAPQGVPAAAHSSPGGQELHQPWTEGDSSVAVTMVQMFKSTLLFTHATLASECRAAPHSGCVSVSVSVSVTHKQREDIRI